MPPDMSQVSMRHTKIKAEEAALLAGELEKPSWESRNEGIHERVSFEDTIWGFDLAGGAYYRTPLRVTFVKPDSRAEKAGIRPGDRLLRINDVDTSTLTIQEAHKIILDSGIHLKLAVTSPDDEEDAYYYYEDPIEDIDEIEEQRRREEEKAKRREVRAKVSSYWSLQWPWVSKRRIIYRESNCFMVPSKYEEKHREKFPTQPFHRYQDDIVLDSTKNTKRKNLEEQNKNDKPIISEPIDNKINGYANGDANENGVNGVEISEMEDESQEEINSQSEDQTEDIVDEESQNDEFSSKNDEIINKVLNTDENIFNDRNIPNYENIPNGDNITNNGSSKDFDNVDLDNDEMNSRNDEIIDEVLNASESITNADDNKIIDGILNNIDEKVNDLDPTNER